MTPKERKAFEYVRDEMHVEPEQVWVEGYGENASGYVNSQPEQDNFCDKNCVWTDHHPDCKLGQPDRQELQAKGKHPAPCARFCEANAFQIEIRNLKAKLENQHPEWYHTKNIHGCDVFYHKTEERSYMSGEITPLYTIPPRRTWVGLTDDELDALTSSLVKGWVVKQLAIAIEAKLKEKNT